MEDLKVQLAHLLLVSDSSLSLNDGGYVDQLAPLVKSALEQGKTEDLLDNIAELRESREKEIQAVYESSDNPFVVAADHLDNIEQKSVDIAKAVQQASSQMDRPTLAYIEHATRQATMARTRENIEGALDTVRLCLQALEHTNQVHQLLKAQHRVAAVQNLHDLQSMGLEKLKHLGLGNMIQRALPALTALIITSTTQALETHFSRLADSIDDLGRRAYDLLTLQRSVWAEIVAHSPHLKSFRFNSSVERAYRHSGTNYLTDTGLTMDLGPLYEAELVFSRLQKLPQLELWLDRQIDSLLDRVVNSRDFRTMTGFCLLNRIISDHVPSLRPAKKVDDAWERIAQNIASFSTKSELKDKSSLLTLKNELCMIMETLVNFQFNVGSIQRLLEVLLRRFSRHLVETTRAEFVERWQNGDRMQLVVDKQSAWDSVLETVLWNDIPASSEKQPFPRPLPFSEVYPLTCADLQHLLNYHAHFFDQFQQDPAIVEEPLVQAIESVLNEIVHQAQLTLRLTNRELIVQTLVDVQYFAHASRRLEKELDRLRMSGRRRGHMALEATVKLRDTAKRAEERVFQLIETSMQDFFSIADYDWQRRDISEDRSTYVLEMTTYLFTLTNTTLVRLPVDVSSLVYLGLADQLSVGLMNILQEAPYGITHEALQTFRLDIDFLQNFVTQIAVESQNQSLDDTLTEVKQVVDLLLSEKPEEYNNPQIRMRKYDRVKPEVAQPLLAKLEFKGTSDDTPVTSPRTAQTGFMRYLAGDRP